MGTRCRGNSILSANRFGWTFSLYSPFLVHPGLSLARWTTKLFTPESSRKSAMGHCCRSADILLELWKTHRVLKRQTRYVPNTRTFHHSQNGLGKWNRIRKTLRLAAAPPGTPPERRSVGVTDSRPRSKGKHHPPGSSAHSFCIGCQVRSTTRPG